MPVRNPAILDQTAAKAPATPAVDQTMKIPVAVAAEVAPAATMVPKRRASKTPAMVLAKNQEVEVKTRLGLDLVAMGRAAVVAPAAAVDQAAAATTIPTTMDLTTTMMTPKMTTIRKTTTMKVQPAKAHPMHASRRGSGRAVGNCKAATAKTQATRHRAVVPTTAK